MINFLWRKIWKNKWLTLCLITGNILLIGIVAGTPLYMTATMQRVMQQDLRNVRLEQNTFPAVMSMRYLFNAVAEPYWLSTYHLTGNQLWPQILEEMGIPSEMSVRTYQATAWGVTPVVPREEPPRTRSMNLAATQGFGQHVRLTHGRMPADSPVDGNIIEVIAMEQKLFGHDFLMDELLLADEMAGSDGPMFVRVVGVFELAEGSEAFWSVAPINIHNVFLASEHLMYERFVRNYSSAYNIAVTWTDVLDFTAMSILQAEHYREVAASTAEQFNHTGSVWWFSQNFTRTIYGHDAGGGRVATTLWILQVPIFVMLALYVYMVSRQILLLDRNDISVLQSRGASRQQILGLYAMQGIFVGAVSFPAGIGLGVILCQALGASNGFLDMVQRETLQVFITGQVLLFGAAAAVFSFLTMFLPVIRFSKIGIVEHKTTKSGKPKKAIWQRYFLDFLFLGVASYGLHSFSARQDLMTAAMAAEAQGVDPLLYLSSSLFIIGAGLVCLRFFPYLVKLIFWLGRRFWSPAVYASLLKVIRSAGEEQFIMLFLVFTVSLGIFSAQAARTINLNNEHLIRYLSGADLMLREAWADNVPEPGGLVIVQMPEFVVYTEPDFERFTGFEEVDSITRVMRRYGRINTRRAAVEDIHLMAIETRTFGETVWFRDDLLRIHMNYFLNILASRPDGVLLSDNFRTALDFQVGDTVHITERSRFGLRPSTGDFIVVGFVEHWPAFSPVERTRVGPAEIVETQAHLAVLNMGHLHTHWGVRPYEIWMSTNTETNQFIYDFIEWNGLHISAFNDAKSALVEVRSEPLVQGTNGVLTVSFIVVLLVCFTGFLIYWILSIRSRVLQFGIFRAMGMSMRSIIGLLVNEQLFITLTALGIGAAIGELSARLFVPLIQISYTAAEQAIPLLVVIEARDYGSLYAVLGLMLVLCMIVLTGYISRIKIDQALKLGED